MELVKILNRCLLAGIELWIKSKSFPIEYYLSSLSVIISLFQKRFCLYVEERYKEAYCEHDLSDNAIDVKKIADDVIDPLIQTRFFREPGDT